MVGTATPWTVRTKRRHAPASVPNLRKRQDVSVHKDEKRKARQQTLTQIQFVPQLPPSFSDNELEPIASVPRQLAAKRDESRLQKRNSTLTQMDFLSPAAVDDDDKENQLQYIRIDDSSEKESGNVVQLDGSIDFKPKSTKRGRRTPVKPGSKEKDTPTVWDEPESQEYKHASKRRKIITPVAGEATAPRRRTSRRLAGMTTVISGGQSLERNGHTSHMKDVDSPCMDIETTPSKKKHKHQVEFIAPSIFEDDQETHSPLARPRPEISIPQTPSKRKNVIPSSQSPESLPPSTRKRTTRQANVSNPSLDRSPLKERSVNVQRAQQQSDYRDGFSKNWKAASPPKRKICVLKFPQRRLEAALANNALEKEGIPSKHTIWSPPSSSPPKESYTKLPPVPMLEIMDSVQEEGSVISNGSAPMAPVLEVKDSVEEEEPEIPETSQLDYEKAISSNEDHEETQETLPTLYGLLGRRKPPADSLLSQLCPGNGKSEHPDTIVKDFAHAHSQDCDSPKLPAGSDQILWLSPPVPDAFPADNMADVEGSVLAMSPGSSIANDTQFNADLAHRIPTSSARASMSPSRSPPQRRSFPPSLQMGWEIEYFLQRPHLVHQPSTHSSSTKVPLNDTHSPTLLPRSTQRAVYPASLPRPSQVSTQAPTQPNLSMSSMLLQPWSSPPRPDQTTITIKDSSSVPMPLHDIPSQIHSDSQFRSQSQLQVKLGLDDCLDPADDDDDNDDNLNADLVAMSDDMDRLADKHNGMGNTANVANVEEDDEVEPSQIDPVPSPMPEAASHTIVKESPVKKRVRKNHKPYIPPEVRALLSESLLESLPGPPGWSQRSWDDELL